MTSKDNLISIIIPCYNRIDLLSLAMKSISKQTYKSIEIILVDDNSPEGGIKKLADQYECRYIRNETNVGAQKSRNAGVKASIGEYIAFMDSDDLWSDCTKLERQLEILISRPNIAVVFTHIQYIDSFGTKFKEQSDKKDYSIDDYKQSVLKKDWVGTYSSVMVRRSDFIKVGMCSEQLPARQDWDLWIKMSQLGNAYRLGTVSIQYRIHEEQISSNPVKKIAGFLSLLETHSAKFVGVKGKSYLFSHFCKILLAIKLFKLDKAYTQRLLHLDRILLHLARLVIFPVMLIIKLPLLGNLIIGRLSKTYLFKGYSL